MLILTTMMVVLLGYQVTMPAVDNAKYTFTVHNGQIVRMNTQNGTFEVCDQTFKCSAPDTQK
jgi:hypothetical protein